MVLVNGQETVDRHNRPSVNSAVLLRAFFINNGAFQDPVDISGVTIFSAARNTNPSSVLNSSGLIDLPSLSANDVLMHFESSSTTAGNAAQPEADYKPGNLASGIYKLGTGEYGVILNGTLNLSGKDSATSKVYSNKVSGASQYIDVWTVKMLTGGLYQTQVQEFSLYSDSFFTVTQPILFTAKNKLKNKRIVYGSKVDLRVGTEVNIDNKDIDQSIKNLFSKSVIASGSMEIIKLNDANGLSSRFEVSGFSDTSALVDITSDNTLVLNWDTTDIAGLAAANETYGGIKGSYEVRAKYTILNQTIKSPPMFLEIR